MQHIRMLVSLTICEAGSKPCLLASNCVSSWPLLSHPALSLPRQYTHKEEITRTACKYQPNGTMPRCRIHLINPKSAHNPLICSLEDTLNCLCCFLSVGSALRIRDVVWCPVQCSANALLQDVTTIASCEERSSSLVPARRTAIRKLGSRGNAANMSARSSSLHAVSCQEHRGHSMYWQAVHELKSANLLQAFLYVEEGSRCTHC